MMKEQVLTLLLCIAGFSTACVKPTVQQTQEPAEAKASECNPTMQLYGLKAPVKSMKEWKISTSILADNPQLNPSTPAAVQQAIDEEVLDGMTTSIVDYQFSADGKVVDWVEYSGNNPSTVRISGMPGRFGVKFENGRPQQYILDQREFQKSLDEGLIFLDGYEMGCEELTMEYNPDGMPASMKGKAMDFFGGGQYSEQYSKYKFDAKGNWISRQVATPNDSFIQYRAYVY